MTRIVVGVIGHVDHGKTALVRALTGMDTDRLAEEKRRGISIALGFAHFEAEGAQVDLIDMPGHERFVRTMISGATGIDAVLLVVAANEGVAPQTVEHLDIAALLGIRRAVLAVTKCDLASGEDAELAGEEALALLAARGFELEHGVDALRTSARGGAGVEALRRRLAQLAGSVPRRGEDGVAWLPVDRAFAIAGQGPVVTGTLRGAAIARGETLELLPDRQRVRVRALQVHGTQVSSAHPGQRTAVNLRDVDKADLKRGMALAAPGALAPSDWLTLAIRSVADAPALANGARLRALFGTAEADVRLRLLDRDLLQPGEDGLAQLHFAEPVSVPAREHVILRIASPARTVAGGAILEPAVRRRRRNVPEVLSRLRDLRDLALPDLLRAELAREGAGGTTLAALARLCALSTGALEELLGPAEAIVTRRGAVFRSADLERARAQVPALLAPHPAGLSRNQLQSALPGTRAALLEETLGRLLADRTVVRRGSQYALPSPEADRARAQGEAALQAAIAETLRLGGLAPPNPAALVTDGRTRRALDRLLREGMAVRAVDRAKGREIIFHRDAVALARERLAPLLADEAGLLVTDIAAALGISRKFAMPLLDHLDTVRFTRRVGDRRVRGPLQDPEPPG